MSPVCFVTERLFPLNSIDDWALELSWRARELAQAGTPVVVLYASINEPPARLGEAREFYRAMGADLLVKEDLPPFLSPDEPLTRGMGGVTGLLVLPALRKLHEQRRFGRIEIPAERGLAFRVIQAQRAGIAFTDTELVVTLGSFGEWQRHRQRRLALRADEIKVDFAERESVELAQSVVTVQPEKVTFVDELGWERGRVGVRPLPRLPAGKIGEIGSCRVPCYCGDPEEEPGFEQFERLIERTTAFPRWLHVEESRNERATAQRRKQLEAAAKSGRAQIEVLHNPDWQSLATTLREKEAFVVLTHPEPGPRLHWLVRRSIPFVFPDSLLAILPERQRGKASRLAYSAREANSLLSALKHARTFAAWPSMLGAWRDSLFAPAPPPSISVADQPGAAVPAQAPPSELPRVTIAVSHYNLKQLLGETLECLEAQTYPACDVVVVDDGSTDPESLETWRGWRTRFPNFSYVELPHAGYWSPRNHAIEHCANPYIIIVDGDNLPRPEMAEVFVRAMERNPEFAAFTSYIAAFPEERAAALRGEFQALNAPLGGDPVSGYFANIYGDTNSIFRAEAIRAIGGFRKDFRCAFGDWELFHRLVGRGHRLGVIPKVLLHYRRRAGGMIRQRTLYREHWEFFEVLDTATHLRPADRRRLSFALHGLALNK
jgi:glycosyltransferase involved in cell wall biosynthesis